MSAVWVRKMIFKGECPADTIYPGNLYAYDVMNLKHLPNNLTIEGYLCIENCNDLVGLPGGLSVLGDEIRIKNCESFTTVPEDLVFHKDVSFENCRRLRELPDEMVVPGDLNLNNTGIKRLPKGLSVFGSLHCDETDIEVVPDDVHIGWSLFLQECHELERLPENLHVHGDLNLWGCTNLKELPSGLVVDGEFNVRDCVALKTLPNDIKLWGPIYVKGSGLEHMMVYEDDDYLFEVVYHDGHYTLASNRFTYEEMIESWGEMGDRNAYIEALKKHRAHLTAVASS